MKSLPIISLSELEKASQQEIKKLYDVCDEHGFFYLKEHGVSSEIVNQTIEASRKFFELPEDVKLNYRQDIQKVYPKTCRGYVPLYGEFLNKEIGFDPKQVFDLGIERPLSEEPFTGPTVIPDDSVAPGFASSHYQLQNEIMTKVTPKLLKGLALALGLEASWFDKYFTEPTLIQRTIYYPAGTGKAGKHTDNGIFTVLIQEYFPEPSLRVHTKEEWIDAPCVEDTFVINLGDLLQMWTNRLFVSTPHEVIHRNSEATRISIPFFVYPNIDAIIEPFGTTEKISSKEVMLKNFVSIWETYEGAGRAKELV
ncbi:2-oxoglutarate and iron-dependent oxygenase domain-containing protein [Okeania sp.]|uniref:2-oxoglutarate and iron-dependent oxygenase domain-containing protein n=1 Tax=Okeania sp. TaxID=3100323 RepID=UPI002B4AB815|nr:2-oxoglutarate and iron-dependent oxygenase domain-containing protein [Okeania sp.]MEB3340620.1 2-oxoglutarate and iron-dependent oxygenase domain-containing protein [Okeania sp.]